jgi:hypothetical protein
VTAPRVVATVMAASLWATALEAKTFESLFVGPTEPLGRALANTVARSLPVISASPGLTFTFDPSSGAFVRDTDLLGQLYLERAQPIGKGKWNVSMSYQRVALDAVQGQELSNLHDTMLPIIVPGRNPPQTKRLVRFDRYALALTVDEMTFQGTYGISDNIEVNLTLPVLFSRLSLGATQPAFTRNPNDNSLVPLPPGQHGTRLERDILHATGVGDLLLRGKYRFLKTEWGDVATGIVLRMPAGSQDNFQGTGNWELSPLLYLSTHRIPVGGPVAVQGFVNGGFDLVLDNADESEARFGAGVDVALGERATLSLAFLGREPFHSFAPAGFFDKPRYNPRTGCPVACASGNTPLAPLFGLTTDRASYYALSMGGRVNLWNDTVFGFASVLVPLTDQGIQTAPIPLIGLEATF